MWTLGVHVWVLLTLLGPAQNPGPAGFPQISPGTRRTRTRGSCAPPGTRVTRTRGFESQGPNPADPLDPIVGMLEIFVEDWSKFDEDASYCIKLSQMRDFSSRFSTGR